MDEILKMYIIQDDSEEDVVYGCLIMNRDAAFDSTLFQTRLDDTVLSDTSSMGYEDIIKSVLSEYPKDYKNVIFIKNSRSFYI